MESAPLERERPPQVAPPLAGPRRPRRGLLPLLLLSTSLLSGALVPGCGGPDGAPDDDPEDTAAAEAAVITGENLALGKTATQSSAYPWGGAAGLAVDGNTSGLWGHGSVTHTNLELSPWWQVDLGSVALVGKVELYNRVDCCAGRLSNFQVLLSADGTSWQAWDHPGVAGTQVSFTVNRSARYVKVQLDATGVADRILSLAEVKVLGVAAQGSLPVPVQPTAPVGALEGRFDVDAQGAATYSIPLQVPPGTHGIEPKLSLAYRSTGGNGPVGMGWMLSGLPMITRCQRTVAQDGANSPVNGLSTDAYCLDGQRLVPVSGANGAAGTAYRTERETFSRIVSHGACVGGPCSFEVRDKSGNTAWLGGTADSRQTFGAGAAVKAWGLNWLQDTNGNRLTVSYTSDNNQLYPDQILYTLNDAAPSMKKRRVAFSYESRPDVERSYHLGHRTLTTKRLSRVKTYVEGASGEVLVRDYRLSYAVSAATKRSLLSSIAECDAQGVCLPATQLAYHSDGPHAGNAATMFDVVQPAGAAYQNDLRYDPGAVIFPGDFDGDGRTDFLRQERGGWDDDNNAGTLKVYLSNGDGTFTIVVPSCVVGGQEMCQSDMKRDPGAELHTGDFDGDGKTDFLRQEHSGWDDDAANTFRVFLSNGNGQFTVAALLPGTEAHLLNKMGGDGVLLHFGDYNGDGRTDFLGQEHGDWDEWNGGDVQVYTANALGQFNFYHPTSGWFHDGMSYDAHVLPFFAETGAYLYPADVDGDGKTDFLRQEHGFWNDDPANNLHVYLSQGNGEFTQVIPHEIFPDGWDWFQHGMPYDGGAAVIPGDFNGDGKSDFVRLEHGEWADDLNGSFQVMFSKGNGSFEVVQPADPQHQTLMHGSYITLTPADFNGDGKTDLLRRGTSDWHPEMPLSVWLSKGDGTFEKLIPPDQQIWQNPYYSSYLPNVNVFPADVDGDGKSDLLWQHKAGLDDDATSNFWVYFWSGPGAVDMLKQVTTGLGGSVAVEYAPLTDPSVHTKAASALGTLTDLQVPLFVVKSYQESNNALDTIDHSFAYTGGRADRDGRGFVGFESVSHTNVTQGSVTKIEYNQWPFPDAGTVKARTVSDLAGTAQVRTDYQYAKSTTYPGVHVIVPTKEEVTHTEAGQSYKTVKEFEHDSFGNLTIVRDRRLDGDASDDLETCTTYSNDAGLWRLDSPTYSRIGTGCSMVNGVCQCTNVLRWIDRYYDWTTMNLVAVYDADLRYGGWPYVDFTYDALGNVIARSVSGKSTRIVETTTWDPDYRTFPIALTRTGGALSQTTLSTYDPRTGALVSKTDENGNQTTYALDGLGRMVSRSETSPDGVLTPIVKIVHGTDAAGIYRETQTRNDWIAQDWRWEREYLDGKGRAREVRSQSTDPSNPIVVERQFDAAGEVSSETLPYSLIPTPLSVEVLTRSFERDWLGRVTEITEPTGVVTQIAYSVDKVACTLCATKVVTTEAVGTEDERAWTRHDDVLGNPRRQIDPDGRAATFGYDRLARRTQVADAAGTTTTVYDSLDRVWSVTSPDRGTLTHEYGVGLWLAHTTDANGVVTSYIYDDLGRVQQKITAGKETVTFSYDDPASVNGSGRLTAVNVVPHGQAAPSSSNAFSYTPSGDVQTNVVTIDGHTYTLASAFDPMRRLRALTYPDGTVLSRSYDAQGQLSQLKIGGTVHAQYGNYNPSGKPGIVTHANGTSTTMAYDDALRLKTLKTKRAGGQTLFSYRYAWDSLYRVTQILDDTKVNTQIFAYSPAGQLVEAWSNAYDTLTFGYDDAGNMTTKEGATFTYTNHRVTSGPGFSASYDAAGNRTGAVRGGDVYQYEHGADNRLRQVKKNGVVVNQFAYDFTGERVKKVDADGTVTHYVTAAYEVTFLDDATLETKYVHGPTGRVAAITVEHPAGAGAMLDLRGLDSASRLFDRRSAAGLLGLALHRAKVWRAHPRAPLFGQVALGLALAAAALAMVRRRAPSRFASAARALRGVVLPERTALSRRHPVFAWAAPVVAAAFLSACGPVPPGEASQQAQQSLVPGANGEGYPVAGTHYFHHNHLGSASLVTDAAGAQVARAEYKPYGEIVQAASPGQDIFRAKFTGKEWDKDSGLYYFSARYYDPFTGRFTTADSQVQGGSERDTASINPYAYANNSPIVYTDPSGQLFWFIIVVAVVAGAYAGASAANGGSWNPASWSWTSWRTYVGLGVGGLVGGIGGAVGIGVGGVAGAMIATAMSSLATNGLRFLSPGGSSAREFALGFSVDMTIGLATAGVMSKLGSADKLGSAFRERLANKMAEKLAGPALAKAVGMSLGKASLKVGGVVGRSFYQDYRQSSSQPVPPPPPPAPARVDESPVTGYLSHLSDALLASTGADDLPGRSARDVRSRQRRAPAMPEYALSAMSP